MGGGWLLCNTSGPSEELSEVEEELMGKKSEEDAEYGLCFQAAAAIAERRQAVDLMTVCVCVHAEKRRTGKRSPRRERRVTA